MALFFSTEERNRNFFIFFYRHTGKSSTIATYLHVFLLTLREVMNNFEARGLHFLYFAVVQEKISEGGQMGGRSSKLDFPFASDKRFFSDERKRFSSFHDMIKWQNFLILQKHENHKYTRLEILRMRERLRHVDKEQKLSIGFIETVFVRLNVS